MPNRWMAGADISSLTDMATGQQITIPISSKPALWVAQMYMINGPSDVLVVICTSFSWK